jgi:hypothetical protein
MWFSLALTFFFQVPAFGLDPGFELPDGFTLHRQLDVGIEGIHFVARGVAHKSLPHVLHDAGFHEARVERVAEIVKAGIADARSTDGCPPGGLDLVDRTAFEGKNQPFRLLE